MARDSFNGALGLTWLFYMIFTASNGVVGASGSCDVSFEQYDTTQAKCICKKGYSVYATLMRPLSDGGFADVVWDRSVDPEHADKSITQHDSGMRTRWDVNVGSSADINILMKVGLRSCSDCDSTQKTETFLKYWSNSRRWIRIYLYRRRFFWVEYRWGETNEYEGKCLWTLNSEHQFHSASGDLKIEIEMDARKSSDNTRLCLNDHCYDWCDFSYNRGGMGTAWEKATTDYGSYEANVYFGVEHSSSYSDYFLRGTIYGAYIYQTYDIGQYRDGDFNLVQRVFDNIVSNGEDDQESATFVCDGSTILEPRHPNPNYDRPYHAVQEFLTCSAGYERLWDEALGIRECTACPGGKFMSSTPTELLNLCTSASCANAHECQDCSLGEYSDPGADYCTLCPSGKYRDSLEAQECMFCPVGTYGQFAGMSACTACSDGRGTQNQTGSTTPDDCDCYPGTLRSEDSSACVCVAGYYCPETWETSTVISALNPIITRGAPWENSDDIAVLGSKTWDFGHEKNALVVLAKVKIDSYNNLGSDVEIIWMSSTGSGKCITEIYDGYFDGCAKEKFLMLSRRRIGGSKQLFFMYASLNEGEFCSANVEVDLENDEHLIKLTFNFLSTNERELNLDVTVGTTVYTGQVFTCTGSWPSTSTFQRNTIGGRIYYDNPWQDCYDNRYPFCVANAPNHINCHTDTENYCDRGNTRGEQSTPTNKFTETIGGIHIFDFIPSQAEQAQVIQNMRVDGDDNQVHVQNIHPCPAGSYSDTTGATDISACQDCPAGQTTPEPAATSIAACERKMCAAGEYDSNPDGVATCLPCPENTFSNASGFGYKINAGGGCYACDEGYDTNGQQGQTACVYACNANEYWSYVDKQCQSCPNNSATAGSTPRFHRDDCECLAGFASTRGLTGLHECAACDEFSYKLLRGNFNCTRCMDVGYVPESTTSAVCSFKCTQNNTYFDQSTEECRACPANSTSFEDPTSIQDCLCDAGFQNIQNNNLQHQCEPCPFASYKNETGNEQCTPCHAFLNTTDRGSTEVFDCECSPGTYQGNIKQLGLTIADIWMNKQRWNNNYPIQWTDTCSEPFQIDASTFSYPRNILSPSLETMMKVVKENPQIYWMGNTNLWYAWSQFNHECDADHNSPTVCERMNECINDGFEDDGRCLCSYNVYTPNNHGSFTTSIRRQAVLTTGNVVHNDGEFVGSQDICYQGSNNYIYIRPHWIFNHTKDTNVLRSCTEHDEGKEGNGWVRHEVTTNDGTSLPTTFSTDWIPSFIYDPDFYPSDNNYPWDSYCPDCPQDWAGYCFFYTGNLEKTDQCYSGNDDPACSSFRCGDVQEQGFTFKEQRQIARVNDFRQRRILTLYREWDDTLTADQCTVCPAGKFKTTVSNHEAQCQDCPVGKYNPETGSISSDACLDCAPGTYQPTTGGNNITACQECPDNSFSLHHGATTRDECNCTAGYHGPGGDACDACAAGKFKAENGSGTCVQCDKGQQSDEGSAKCTDCPAGKYSIDGEYECYSCSAGVYTPQAKMTTCLQCQAGQRSENDVRSTTCVDCSPGTTSTPPDLSEWSYTPGEVPGDASHICEPCAAGSYNPHFGSPACTLCGKGKYNPDSGSNSSAACLPCAAGTFNGHEGQAACVECFKGAFSEPGSTEFTDCHCAAGSQDDSWAFQHTNGLYYMKLDPEKNFVDNGAARTEWSALRLKDAPSLDATSATVLLNDYTFAQKGTQSLAGVERDDTFFQHSNGHWYMKVNPDENWSERSEGTNVNQRTYFHAVRLLKKPSREDDEVYIVTDDFTFATGARNQKWMSALNSFSGSWWRDARFKIDLTNTPLTMEGSSQPTCCFGWNAKSGTWVDDAITEFTATMNAGGDHGYTGIDCASSGASNEDWECAYPLYTYHSVD